MSPAFIAIVVTVVTVAVFGLAIAATGGASRTVSARRALPFPPSAARQPAPPRPSRRADGGPGHRDRRRCRSEVSGRIAMLRQLENQYDTAEDLSGSLPSGDDLAAEVEQFLRDQD